MSLWKNEDTANGYGKPLFANTTNAWSRSTINGSKANTNKYYGNVYGVSAAEDAANPHTSSHAGWVSQKIGTGPVATISIASGGTGVNTAGFVLVTDGPGSYLGQGTGVNISYTIANTRNTMQAFSTNAAWNVVNSVTIVSNGSGYSNVNALTTTITGTSITAPTFNFTLGGRGGRINYETIVAMGSITGDDPRDNVYFSGI
jgi:hypothetical protein